MRKQNWLLIPLWTNCLKASVKVSLIPVYEKAACVRGGSFEWWDRWRLHKVRNRPTTSGPSSDSVPFLLCNYDVSWTPISLDWDLHFQSMLQNTHWYFDLIKRKIIYKGPFICCDLWNKRVTQRNELRPARVQRSQENRNPKTLLTHTACSRLSHAGRTQKLSITSESRRRGPTRVLSMEPLIPLYEKSWEFS